MRALKLFVFCGRYIPGALILRMTILADRERDRLEREPKESREILHRFW